MLKLVVFHLTYYTTCLAKAEKLILNKNSQAQKLPSWLKVGLEIVIICDSDCAIWKHAKICLHTIACAFVDGQLQTFLSQAKSAPSLYQLAKSDTVQNAGKKPTKRKACSKSTMKVTIQLKEDQFQVPTSIPMSASQPVITDHKTRDSPSSDSLLTLDTAGLTVLSQGNIHATITCCNSVQLSTYTTRSPVC